MKLKTVYSEIMEQLVAQVPELQFIDLDRGQYEDPANNYIPSFPSCLINFNDIPWGSVGDKILQGDAQFSLRVAFPIYDDVTNLTPEDIRNAGLANLDILDKISLAIEEFTGSIFNGCQLVNTSQENNGAQVIFNLAYRTMITDNSARVKHYTTETISLKVEVEI